MQPNLRLEIWNFITKEGKFDLWPNPLVYLKNKNNEDIGNKILEQSS
jgi:hypothetical protein